VTPVVIAPGGAVLARLRALRYLTETASVGTLSPSAQDQQVPGGGPGRSPAGTVPEPAGRR